MSASESNVVRLTLADEQITQMQRVLRELTTTEDSLTQQALQALTGLTKLIAQINDGPDKEFLQKARDKFEIIANGTTFWSEKTTQLDSTEEILTAIYEMKENIKVQENPVALRFIACMWLTVNAQGLNRILSNPAHTEIIADINEQLKSDFNNQLSLAYVISPPYQRIPRILMLINECVKVLGESHNHNAKSLALKFMELGGEINSMTPESSTPGQTVQTRTDSLLEKFLTGLKSFFNSNQSLEISQHSHSDVNSSVDLSNAYFQSVTATLDLSKQTLPSIAPQEKHRDHSSELRDVIDLYDDLEAEIKGNQNPANLTLSSSSSSSIHSSPVTQPVLSSNHLDDDDYSSSDDDENALFLSTPILTNNDAEISMGSQTHSPSAQVVDGGQPLQNIQQTHSSKPQLPPRELITSPSSENYTACDSTPGQNSPRSDDGQSELSSGKHDAEKSVSGFSQSAMLTNQPVSNTNDADRVTNYLKKIKNSDSLYELGFFGGTAFDNKKVPANVARMLTVERNETDARVKLQKIAGISVEARFNRGCTRYNSTQQVYEDTLKDLGVNAEESRNRILGEIDDKFSGRKVKPRTVARIESLLKAKNEITIDLNDIAEVIRLAQEAAGSWKQYIPFYGRSEKTQAFYKDITLLLDFTAPRTHQDHDDDEQMQHRN